VVTQADIVRNYQSGDMLALKVSAKAMLAAFPTDFTALTALGLSLSQSPRRYDWRKAISVYLSVLDEAQTAEEASTACHSISHMHLLVNQYDDAADWFRRGWLGNPHSPPIPNDPSLTVMIPENGLGETLFELSRLDPANAPHINSVGPNVLRLRPMIERAGFRFANDKSMPSIPAFSYALKFQPNGAMQRTTFTPSATHRAKWMAKLVNYPRPWIGISWTGGIEPERTAARTIPVQSMVRLTKGLPGTLIDMQHSTHACHAKHVVTTQNAFRENNIKALPFSCEDVEDLGALLSCLDVVATADNSNAHLGAALGVPVLLLLNQYPYIYFDERIEGIWKTVNTVKQFRFGEWEPVIQEARQRLEKLLALKAA